MEYQWLETVGPRWYFRKLFSFYNLVMDFSNFNRMVEVSYDFICCCPPLEPTLSVIVSFFFFNAENQFLSKISNVFLGGLHDLKQTNKPRVTLVLQEKFELFFSFSNELSLWICWLGSLNSSEVKGEQGVFDNLSARGKWSSVMLNHFDVATPVTQLKRKAEVQVVSVK